MTLAGAEQAGVDATERLLLGFQVTVGGAGLSSGDGGRHSESGARAAESDGGALAIGQSTAADMIGRDKEVGRVVGGDV